MRATTISRSTGSAEETRAVGQALAGALSAGDVVALEGELGAGKTVLVQGIAAGLGVGEGVHSPTFVLRHRYQGRIPVEHVDLYRLEGSGWLDAGLDEPSPDAVTLIEWSNRAATLEDWATVRLHLSVEDDERRVITLLKGSRAVASCLQHGASAGP